MTFFRRLFALSVAGLLFAGACHAAPKRYALVAHKPAALTQPPFAPPPLRSKGGFMALPPKAIS